MTVSTSNYAKYQTGNPVVRRLIDRFYGRVAELVASLEPRSLLDAGCGEGETLARLRRPLPDTVVGFDILEDSVRYAAARHPEQRFVVESIYSTSFADKAFEAAVCLEVFEHLATPDRALAELLRVTSKDIILSVPDEPWFQLGNLCRGKYLSGWGNHPEHINHWSPASFHAFLAEQAEVVSVERRFPWIVAHCRPRSGATV